MGIPAFDLGHRHGPFESVIGPEEIRAYADATGDTNPAYVGGLAVPPIAIVTQIFDAQAAGHSHWAPEVRAAMITGVHGEHDIVYDRPIDPDERLYTYVEPFCARVGGERARMTIHFETVDADGEPIVEQWWTTVLILREAVGESVGRDKPDHAFPDHARSAPLAEMTIPIDVDMAKRYAEVSTDFSAHHFDDEAARKGGFKGVFLHGLCTMGLCARAVVDSLAEGDPDNVLRMAVRFASPAYIGDDLTVRMYDAGYSLDGLRSVAFEAEAGGAIVISNGRAELAS
jgi:acyl dehydratase